MLSISKLVRAGAWVDGLVIPNKYISIIYPLIMNYISIVNLFGDTNDDNNFYVVELKNIGLVLNL